MGIRTPEEAEAVYRAAPKATLQEFAAARDCFVAELVDGLRLVQIVEWLAARLRRW